MPEPTASHPHWPDALEKSAANTTANLKPWSWALERLQKSHNYWISTSTAAGNPHLMIVWGIWWEDAFWFSTGPRTRKAKNIAAQSNCVIGTEKADEAVILEGLAEVISDRAVWKRLAEIYNRKYGGDLYPILDSCDGNVYRVIPSLAFGQDEHAEDFLASATRWRF